MSPISNWILILRIGRSSERTKCDKLNGEVEPLKAISYQIIVAACTTWLRFKSTELVSIFAADTTAINDSTVVFIRGNSRGFTLIKSCSPTIFIKSTHSTQLLAILPQPETIFIFNVCLRIQFISQKILQSRWKFDWNIGICSIWRWKFV